MKTKLSKSLPKTAGEITNGGIYQQKVSCGKPNCKCAQGEKHTAFYFFASRNGKLTKTYIRKGELEEFTEIVDQAKADRINKRQSIKESNEFLRRLNKSLREYQEITKLYKEVTGDDRI